MSKLTRLVVLGLMCVIGFSLTGCTSEENKDKGTDQISEQSKDAQDGESTSMAEDDEQAPAIDKLSIEGLPGVAGINPASTLTISIVGPEEDNFAAGQARMWKAQIKVAKSYWNDSPSSLLEYICEWKYAYGDQPYTSQTLNPGFLSEGREENDCAFTSTFIGLAGEVTATVNMNIFKSSAVFDSSGAYVEQKKDLVETLVASRKYTVR